MHIVPGNDRARLDRTAGGPDDEDVITEWSDPNRSFVPASIRWPILILRNQLLDLSGSVDSTIDLRGIEAFEIYDYPGGFKTKDDAVTTAAGLRMEEEESAHKRIQGAGVCRSFASGHKFDLNGPFRPDANISLRAD